MDPSRSTSYQPLTEPTVGIELANVKTPNDAVAFVRRFGLLRQHEMLNDGTYVKYDAQRGQLLTDFQSPIEKLREVLSPDTGRASRQQRGRGFDKPTSSNHDYSLRL